MGEREPRDVDLRRSQSQDEVDAFDARALGIDPNGKGPKARVARFAEQHRWHWLGRVLQVQQRFSELRGNQIAAAVTLQSFLAIFPLLLVAIAIVGYISANGTDVAGRVVSNLGLTGPAATTMTDAIATAQRSRNATTIVGLLGLAWAGFALVGALQTASDQVWQVAGRGFKDKLWGLLWLVGATVALLASGLLTSLVNFVPVGVKPLSWFAGLLVTIALWWWTFKVLTDIDVGWRSLLPGAIVGGIGFEVLKALGAFLVPRLVTSSSQLYGTIGVVFALIAWLLYFGRLFVYANVLNVVLHEGHHGTEVAPVRVPRQGAQAAEATRGGAEGKQAADEVPAPAP